MICKWHTIRLCMYSIRLFVNASTIRWYIFFCCSDVSNLSDIMTEQTPKPPKLKRSEIFDRLVKMFSIIAKCSSNVDIISSIRVFFNVILVEPFSIGFASSISSFGTSFNVIWLKSISISSTALRKLFVLFFVSKICLYSE